MILTDRELAIVLAALRHAQAETRPEWDLAKGFPGHFEDCSDERVSEQEIDKLCELLNTFQSLMSARYDRT